MINFSMSFDEQGNTEIGQYLFILVFDPALKTGTTLAIFKLSGKMPELKT